MIKRLLLVTTALMLPISALAQERHHGQGDHGQGPQGPAGPPHMPQAHPPQPHPTPTHMPPAQMRPPAGQPGMARPPQPAHPAARPAPPTYRPGQGRPPQFRPIARPRFVYPRGYGYRRWRPGLVLPPLFFSGYYYFDDWLDLGVGPPPPGYRWVRYGPDLLLVQRRTHRIVDVIYGAFL